MTSYTTSNQNGECIVKFDVIHYSIGRNRICVQATEAEVARAKNVFKTNLFMQLDGMFFIAFVNLKFIMNPQGPHQYVRILEGNFVIS